MSKTRRYGARKRTDDQSKTLLAALKGKLRAANERELVARLRTALKELEANR